MDKAVKLAVNLIFICLITDLIKSFFVTALTPYWQVKEIDLLPAVLLSIQVFGMLGLKIQGRKWVRMILILIFTTSTIGYAISGFEELSLHILIGLTSFGQSTIQIVILVMLFNKPVKNWFS